MWVKAKDPGGIKGTQFSLEAREWPFLTPHPLSCLSLHVQDISFVVFGAAFLLPPQKGLIHAFLVLAFPLLFSLKAAI